MNDPSTNQLLERFRAARRAAVPLLAITTPDPAATMRSISTVTNGSPVVSWDIVRGLRGMNDTGKAAVSQVCDGGDPAMLANPVESLQLACKFPDASVLFFLNAQRFVTNEAVAQAVWNLRDIYKQNKRTLVLLAPSITLPAELTNDVILLDEPLPDAEQLTAIVGDIYKAANLDTPDETTLTKAIDATSGLSAFSAEQVTAMSMTREGVNVSELWERKRRSIEQTPGLSVWRGKESFNDIGGVQNAKQFLTAVLNGNQAPAAIVFIDEIEKALSGTSGDTSGVSQEMLGTLLTYMQDTQATGVICVGPPGAAKSLIAKAAGNTAGIPTIAMDLSGMKGSLVGESGANLRNALKVITAVSQNRALFIATCNAIAALPPELRRRFSFGTFFFDLPTAEERAAIWTLYIDKYAIADATRPNDDGWTGAEIRQCCDLAYRLNTSLANAASYIVPVARSAAESIAKLRQQADGRFISASYAGVYRYERDEQVKAPTGRALEVI